MHLGQQHGEPNQTVHELLVRAASVSGADRVLVVLTHGDAGAQAILADFSTGAGGSFDNEYGIYEAHPLDVLIDLDYQGQLLGSLVFSNPSAGIDRSILDAYALAAAFMLGYASELRDVARSTEESRVLRQLGLQLGEPTDLSQMLGSITNGARQVLKADYAAIATVAPDGTSRWIAMSGNRTDAYLHTVFQPGQGMAARVVNTRQPVILHGIGTSPNLRSEEFPVHVAEKGVSAFAVPMMRGGKPFGALIVGSRAPRSWHESDMQLAIVLGNGAAVAISQFQESVAERSQRAFFENVIEAFPGVLVVLAPPDFRIVRANRGLTELLAEPYRSGEPVIGHRLKDLSATGWDQRSEAVAVMLQRVADSGEPISFQQYPSEDALTGETKYWNWTAAPIGGLGDDEQSLVMLIAQDITELVHAQQKEQQAGETARARAEELETVIRQMADGVLIFDADGKIIKFNPASVALLGRNLDMSAERRSFPKLYGLYTSSNEVYREEDLPVTHALKGDTVTGAQLVVQRPDGQEVILSVSAAPLKDSLGTITGAVTVLRDVTQDKMAERLKDEFLSVVSHELRTPLSAIMGYSDLMLRGVHGAMSEKQAKALSAVRANADRLLHLINDLLDVSRLESGAVPLYVEPINLGEAIARIITQTRVLAVNAGLTVRNEVPLHGIPRALADEARIQQVIENLLSNAIKFTPVGGSIVFRAEMSRLPADEEAVFGRGSSTGDPSEARSLLISVTDTGTGLESDQLSRIWDRFYQVDTSAKRRSGGAGLGLAIVRSLVELHGGLIQATSDGVSLGTSFTFSLPVSESQVETTSRPESKDRAIAYSVRGAQDPDAQTVLVVEDDKDQREIICAMLEMEGYRVVLAEDGEEAIDIARNLLPSAIALDVMLPRSDGWEVLSRLKTEDSTRNIPVLIISVVDQQDFGKNLGADEYLIKPLEAASLRSAVRRLIKPGS